MPAKKASGKKSSGFGGKKATGNAKGGTKSSKTGSKKVTSRKTPPSTRSGAPFGGGNLY
jgi:hypothetical protein